MSKTIEENTIPLRGKESPEEYRARMEEVARLAESINEEEDKTLELRSTLNDFFQDIDTEANIDADAANAIVDVYLKRVGLLITKSNEECMEQLELAAYNFVRDRDKDLSYELGEYLEEYKKQIKGNNVK